HRAARREESRERAARRAHRESERVAGGSGQGERGAADHHPSRARSRDRAGRSAQGDREGPGRGGSIRPARAGHRDEGCDQGADRARRARSDPPSEAAAPLGNIDNLTVIDPSGASKLTDTVVRTAAEGTAIAKSLLGVDLAELMGRLASRRNGEEKS